jgi:hypothetical protein
MVQYDLITLHSSELVEIASAVNRFVNHPVWHTKSDDTQNQVEERTVSPGGKPYWVLMESRLAEMLDRRRRLIRYMLKKEGKIQSGSKDTSEFDVLFKEAIAKKNNVVHRFSSSQLEELLKTSTKNVA